MKENLSAGRIEFLRDLAARHPDSVNLEGETVLALLSRLERAEQDRVKLMNRLDAMRRQRDGYRNQLRRAEQQVARVRAMAQDWDANGNACALGDHSADVWHATANSIRIELDRMARTNQGENND